MLQDEGFKIICYFCWDNLWEQTMTCDRLLSTWRPRPYSAMQII